MIGRGTATMLAIALALARAALLPGCAITLATTTFVPSKTTAAGAEPKPASTTTLDLEPLAKSGVDVFTVAFTSIGIWCATSDPTAGGLPTVNARWLKAQITRVPAFRAGLVVPSVTATTTLDATTGAHIADSLEVGTYANESETSADADTTKGDSP